MFDFLNERNKTKLGVNKLEKEVNSFILTRHPKCKGFFTPDTGWGSEFDCEYGSKLDCEECKYGMGRKDPEAKCNQFK